jgi:hypothetical protein
MNQPTMTRDQAVKIMANVGASWGGWDLTQEASERWIAMLMSLSVDIAKRAWSTYWETTKTATPRQGDFKTVVDRIKREDAERMPPAPEENPNGYAGVCVACVAKDVNGPGPLGEVKPLYFNSPDKIPDPDVVLRIAEAQRRNYGGYTETDEHGQQITRPALYRGVWEIWQGLTVQEAVAKGWGTRGKVRGLG